MKAAILGTAIVMISACGKAQNHMTSGSNIAQIGQSSNHIDSIGIGIDWKSSIFVQEYWLGDSAYYQIFNSKAEDQAIGHNVWRLDDKGSAEIIKIFTDRWEVPAHSVRSFSLQEVMNVAHCGLDCGQGLYLKDEAYIGALRLPVRGRNSSTQAVVKISELNSVHSYEDSVWTEEATAVTTRSQLIEVKLKSTLMTGSLSFSTDGWTVAELSNAVIVDAYSKTATVSRSEHSIDVQFLPLSPGTEFHEVDLRFSRPSISTSDMTAIAGYLCVVGDSNNCLRGSWVVRGVALEAKSGFRDIRRHN